VPDTSRTFAVADALHSAAIHLLRGVRKEDIRTGIGPAQLSALSVLVFAGSMRVTQLARMEQVKAPTMTKIIGSLERAGLIERRPDPDDNRAVTVVATKRGEKLLQEGRRRRVQRLASAIGNLASRDRDVLLAAAPLIEELARRI
jgi:DNA-binding MarR family transcriptional regulator